MAENGSIKIYDVEELSEMLNIQERTVRNLFKDGVLKGKKLGRKWYITAEALKEYFEQEESPEEA
jgi:excisionase family DNA binding protein